MVQAFQTIISRNKRPIDAGVISVTMIHAGEATNVVPDSCEIQGTVRTFTLEVLDLIERRMKDDRRAHLRRVRAPSCEFEFKRNYPPTINHPAETEFARRVMTEMVGAENVHEFEPTMGAEDFSYFLLEKPGCYFLIGNGDGTHREGGHGMGPCMLHNPSYDFNDELIPLGAHRSGCAWPKPGSRAERADDARSSAPMSDAAARIFSQSYAEARDKFFAAAARRAASASRRTSTRCSAATARCWRWTSRATGRTTRKSLLDRQQRLPRRRGLLRLGRAGRAARRRRLARRRDATPASPCSTSTASIPTASRGGGARRTRTST